MPAPESALRQAREATVRRHMQAENVHDFDAVIGTFSHPRYELIATGQVHDGEAAVRQYFRDTRSAFPDQRNELIELRHADDCVIAEFWLLGTHRGALLGIAPTGREFRCRMTALFLFEKEDLVCERVYFDSATILRQLTSPEPELPELGQVVGAILARVAAPQRPLLIALAERMAAERYRGWAAQPELAAERAELLACAAREEQIAERVEALLPGAAAIERGLLAQHPDLDTLTRALFEPHPLREQLRLQARGERLGAATWRSFAERAESEAARQTFLACAPLEELSAAVLERILEAKG